MVSIDVEETYELAPPVLGWGWHLGAGIAWIFIGLSILSARPTSIGLISFMVGGVLLAAGAVELLNAFVVPGWRWLHIVIGVLFLAAGVSAFTQPFQTFLGLALLFGWYLLLKGMVVMIVSIALRGPDTLWGLGLAVGIANLVVGVWAIGYPVRSAWLLVVWIGIGALLHGVADIVTAFQVRAAR